MEIKTPSVELNKKVDDLIRKYNRTELTVLILNYFTKL